MTLNRVTLAVAGLLFFSAAAVLSAQPPPQDAGKITAVRPQAELTHGPDTQEAALGLEVHFQDIVTTHRAGRARLGLLDGSSLNIGPESQVEIIRHDQVTEQSELVLRFGKMRAAVRHLTRPDSRFEVRTDTAVAGVIGSDMYLDATATQTYVLCLDGIVFVTSSDPRVGGIVILFPGEAVTVETGKPPGPKYTATEK